MAELIRGSITFVLANFPLTFFVIGLIASLTAIARAHPKSLVLIFEKLLAWHIFWALGVCYLYNFVMHVFFGAMAASFIGWANSPFQFEVGTASLGFAVVAFFAAFRGAEVRFAAITGPAMFSLGAAIGHIRQMIIANNFAPGNAGVIFYTDIFIPVFGWLVFWLLYRMKQQEAGA